MLVLAVAFSAISLINVLCSSYNCVCTVDFDLCEYLQSAALPAPPAWASDVAAPHPPTQSAWDSEVQILRDDTEPAPSVSPASTSASTASEYSPPPPSLNPVLLPAALQKSTMAASPYGPFESGSPFEPPFKNASPTGDRKDTIMRILSVLQDAEKYVDERVAAIRSVALTHIARGPRNPQDPPNQKPNSQEDVKEQELHVQVVLDLDFQEITSTFNEAGLVEILKSERCRPFIY